MAGGLGSVGINDNRLMMRNTSSRWWPRLGALALWALAAASLAYWGLKFSAGPNAHLQAHQDAPVVGALVAVVEQADVPARAHQAQELHQRAGPLGKTKRSSRSSLASAEWPPTMWRMCSLASSSCVRSSASKAVLVEVVGDLGAFALAVGGQAHEHMGLLAASLMR
jgi:hypothetical protein